VIQPPHRLTLHSRKSDVEEQAFERAPDNWDPSWAKCFVSDEGDLTNVGEIQGRYENLNGFVLS